MVVFSFHFLADPYISAISMSQLLANWDSQRTPLEEWEKLKDSHDDALAKMIVSSTWENDWRRRAVSLNIFDAQELPGFVQKCGSRPVLHPVSWILIGNIDGKMNMLYMLCEIVLNHGVLAENFLSVDFTWKGNMLE